MPKRGREGRVLEFFNQDLGDYVILLLNLFCLIIELTFGDEPDIILWQGSFYREKDSLDVILKLNR